MASFLVALAMSLTVGVGAIFGVAVEEGAERMAAGPPRGRVKGLP